MRYWFVAAAAVLAAEATAIACSCMTTDDPAELRTFAADAAKTAIALVEVETTLSYAESNGAGDRMRVVRTVAGAAAGQFRVKRGHFPSGASCDLLFERGQRAVVILYPAARSSGSEPTYRISGLCTGHLLEKPIFRDEVARLIEKSEGSERG